MKHTQAEDAACELAALYTLGALDEDEARSFREHLAGGCAACAGEVKAFTATCAALAWATEPRTPPAAVRGKLLARIDAEPRGPSSPAPVMQARDSSADAGADALASACDLLTVRAGEGEWVETADPGVFVKPLYFDRVHETYTTLVRILPGARVPRHRHTGVEQCLVLEGDLTAGGQTLHAGDFNCAPAGSVHDELTTENGALFLIIAPESYEVLRPQAG
jgi:anti-sigma factor ChrR (cupin superfamily)